MGERWSGVGRCFILKESRCRASPLPLSKAGYIIAGLVDRQHICACVTRSRFHARHKASSSFNVRPLGELSVHPRVRPPREHAGNFHGRAAAALACALPQRCATSTYTFERTTPASARPPPRCRCRRRCAASAPRASRAPEAAARACWRSRACAPSARAPPTCA
jgi:hypothetical protein